MESGGPNPTETPSSPPGWQDFYQRFEDRFRGSPSAIKDRLATRYGQRIGSLLSKISSTGVKQHLDLGCGRGELLQICQELGWQSRGIDDNYSAIQRNLEQKLEVSHGDILELLRSVPSVSLGFVSCLHVVEHCPPEYVFQFVREAYRCLVPRGALLLETPSLFSLWSGVRQFYLDPTHQRPVHPDYLAFLAEDLGFRSQQVLSFDPVISSDRCDFLKFHSDESQPRLQALNDFLFGAMDIAIWAEK